MESPKLRGLPREDNQQIQLCFYVKFPSFGSFLRSYQTTLPLRRLYMLSLRFYILSNIVIYIFLRFLCFYVLFIHFNIYIINLNLKHPVLRTKHPHSCLGCLWTRLGPLINAQRGGFGSRPPKVPRAPNGVFKFKFWRFCYKC